MHKEAIEELNVRLKLVVLEFANHFGVTKPAGNSTSLAPPLIGGKRNSQ